MAGISILGRRFAVPRTRFGRSVVGGAFVGGGALGFLPVLGYWMIPVGVAVLSVDYPQVRRMRRRSEVAVVRRWRSWRRRRG